QLSDINSAMSRSANNVAGNAPAEWETPDHLHHGFDFTSEANYNITRDIRVGINYGRTFGESKKDFVQILTVNSQATTITPRAFYRLPWRPLENMSVHAFGGLILLRNARTKVEHENTNKATPRLESLTLKGSGTGFTAGAMGEYTISDRFTLSFEGGYR